TFPAPATPAIYTLSLHDALPIFPERSLLSLDESLMEFTSSLTSAILSRYWRSTPLISLFILFFILRSSSRFSLSFTMLLLVEDRSEEHTSELQSRENLVCRLLLE